MPERRALDLEFRAPVPRSGRGCEGALQLDRDVVRRFPRRRRGAEEDFRAARFLGDSTAAQIGRARGFDADAVFTVRSSPAVS